jgi:hypothetical protein
MSMALSYLWGWLMALLPRQKPAPKEELQPLTPEQINRKWEGRN